MSTTERWSECKRHSDPTHIRPDSSPWYVRRCAHLGNRFVVEIRHVDGTPRGFIDYVEDILDADGKWTGECNVEGNSVGDWDSVTKAYVENLEAWDAMNEKMLAGIPPENGF